MTIKVLAENTTTSKNLDSEHGLSLYIETKKHRLLFDTGKSSLFAQNALKMGIDLSLVDIAVISHGHYDHGGGIETFMALNSHAPIYISKRAFEPHYANRPGAEKEYIGLNPGLLPNSRFIFTAERLVIDEELELFSDVTGNIFIPTGNKDLFVKNGETFLPDDFAHEQNLIIRESGKILLVAGCSHRGIINILEHFKAEQSALPNFVAGGLHLSNPVTNGRENLDTVNEIDKYLLHTKAKFYACHCTGVESYNRLLTVMGKNIEYFSTGDQLTI